MTTENGGITEVIAGLTQESQPNYHNKTLSAGSVLDRETISHF